MSIESIDWRERLGGRRVVASVSGGKDSAAMSLWLTEQGIEHDRVFCDTGWEHADTYEYLRGALTAKLGPITEVRSAKYPGGMAEMIRARKGFPARVRRFCTQELKVYPLAKFLNDRQDVADCVNAVGIRAAESVARSQLSEWEWQDIFECEVWRPLIRWSEEDVIAIHTRHGLRPNPLYLRGAERVGCWPCIFARKAEIALVARETPERIDQIAVLEADLSADADARGVGKGPSAMSRTFFSVWDGDLGTSRNGAIEEVVAWSRTSRGGKQLKLLLNDEPEGCVRWGLCEAAKGE
jgi:3'-phosphoadenosine 5'-phosphosulfate sulfotransferase (PAPS reductase)/FAD synthetase